MRTKLTVLSEPATAEADWPARSRPRRPLRIALVNMPWATTETPSIQCGLLQAGLARFGHHVDVHYLNLDLAAALGPAVYEMVLRLPSEHQNLAGDWLFTVAAYGGQGADTGAADPGGYLARHPTISEALAGGGHAVEEIVRLRDEVVPQWTVRQAETGRWGGYDLIGFTSSHMQNLAAIALAQEIKRRHPQVVTVFGGANFDGEMGPEFVRCFTAIDFAVSGEGDVILPVLAARLSAGETPIGLPGVCGRTAVGEVVANGQAPKVKDMDALPEPDYTDYFATLDRLGVEAVLGDNRPLLVFESSRGCWWGEKHHCTFCGLNAMSMAYRSKSPQRMYQELGSLTDRYRTLALQAVDNILDMRYFTTLCEQLAGARWDMSIFYEVKANLSRQQVHALKRAGITGIQPGIESLSSRVLSLMRKGSTMLTNVALLKWCRYYGIRVAWNVLYGFPGEHDEDYEEQIALIPSLFHLFPPAGLGEIWLERFSPYFFGEFPIHDVRPVEAYRYVYPIDGIDLDRIAYYFDFRPDQASSEGVRERLRRAVVRWRDLWSEGERPVLVTQRGRGWLSILDTRAETPRQLSLSGWRAEAFERCGDKPRTAGRIRESLQATAELTEDELAGFLDSCVAQRLMVTEGGKYLNLSVPGNGNW